MILSPADERVCKILDMADVKFCGFQSTSLAMIAHGWEVMYEEVQDGRYRFAFRQHAMSYGQGTTMMSEVLDLYRVLGYHRYKTPEVLQRYVLNIEQMIPDDAQMLIVPSLAGMDGGFNMMRKESKEAKGWQKFPATEFYGFIRPNERPDGIVITSDNVGAVLEIIRKVQAPEQQKIREKVRREEARVRMHQQIVTVE